MYYSDDDIWGELVKDTAIVNLSLVNTDGLRMNASNHNSRYG